MFLGVEESRINKPLRRKDTKKMSNDCFEAIATEIVDAAYTVHKEMGPGLLESVYEFCLVKEFQIRKIKCETQVCVPLLYKGYEISRDLRIDLLIEDEIIIELKAVESILPVHEAQIISYLKLMDKRLGFLINFNVPIIKHGMKRFVNKY